MKTTRHAQREATELLDRAITRRCSPAMKAAAAVLIAVGAVGWSAPSHAQATFGAELRLADLENAFWVCDHKATISVIDSGSAATCARLTDALKQRKFSGDFNALLAWWRQHKEAEHLALAKAGAMPHARLAPTAPQ